MPWPVSVAAVEDAGAMVISAVKIRDQRTDMYQPRLRGDHSKRCTRIGEGEERMVAMEGWLDVLGIWERKSERALVGFVAALGEVGSSVAREERREDVTEGGFVVSVVLLRRGAEGCTERTLMMVRRVCRGRSGSQLSSHVGVGTNEPRPAL
jgi:hypothetical protein